MSVQMCEGIWRNRTGQRVVITRCEPVGGQQWTDGCEFYSDDGRYYQSEREDSQDLVTFVGLLPDMSQRAPVSRPAETESTTARYISTNEALDEKTAEIARLQAELQQTQAWRTAATDAHSQSETLRIEQAAEIERLQTELRGYAADSHRQLRTLQESHNKVTANLQAEQRGEREGFRIAISMILEALK